MTNEDDDNRIQGTHDKYTDAYINILNAYKNQISNSVTKKNELKERFFEVIKQIMVWLTWIFAGTLVLSLIIFGLMIWNNYNSVAIITGAITTILSSFTTMILSIFKLPKIIANYLFNKKEDKLMSEIIQNIQKYEIDAVKYELDNLKYEFVELEKVKLEKLKELNSEVTNDSSDLDNNSDAALTDSTYDIPPQDADIQPDETQIENVNEEYSI